MLSMNTHHYHDTCADILKLMCVCMYVWHWKVQYSLTTCYMHNVGKGSLLYILCIHIELNYYVWVCVVAESVLMDL